MEEVIESDEDELDEDDESSDEEMRTGIFQTIDLTYGTGCKDFCGDHLVTLTLLDMYMYLYIRVGSYSNQELIVNKRAL